MPHSLAQSRIVLAEIAIDHIIYDVGCDLFCSARCITLLFTTRRQRKRCDAY